MSQQRFHNYEDGLVSFTEISRFAGILPPGRYRGFDNISIDGTWAFSVRHIATGYTKIDSSESATTPHGIYVTPQGTIITENATIGSYTVDSNAANAFERIDALVASHSYDASTGGSAATYSIVKGALGGAAYPSVVTAETDVILGYLHIPASASDLTGATWEPAESANLNGIDYGRRAEENTWTESQISDFDAAGDQLVSIDSSEELELGPGNIFLVDNGATYDLSRIYSIGKGALVLLKFAEDTTINHDDTKIDLGVAHLTSYTPTIKAGDWIILVQTDTSENYGVWEMVASNTLFTGQIASPFLELNAKDPISGGSHISRLFLSTAGSAADGKKYYMYAAFGSMGSGTTAVYLPISSGYIPIMKHGVQEAWADKAHSSGDYTISHGAISVSIGSLIYYRYRRMGNEVVLSISIDSATISGSPGDTVFIALPAGYTVKGNHVGNGYALDNNGQEAALVEARHGETSLRVYKDFTQATNWSVGSFDLRATITLEIQ